jgi:hypothetical protein
MQQLRADHGIAVFQRALRLLSIRLRSRPQTQPLAPAIDALRAKVAAADDASAHAVEERVGATAELDYRDGLLDGCVAGLARETLVLTNGDRSDPRYTKLFAVAPSAGMKPTAGDVQARYVKAILARLAEDADLAPLKPRAVEIEAALAAVVEAEQRREGLFVAETKATVERRMVLDEARRAYNRTAAELTLILDDVALVDSYFLDLRSAQAARAASNDVEPPTP